MAGTERSEKSGLKLVFLGTSAAIQVPSFHCTCAVCEAARRNPAQRRTRASLALLGQETTLIDAGPDLDLKVGKTIHLDGSRSSDNVGIVNWTWSYPSGGREITLYGPTPSHRFDEPGSYTLTLIVTDATGLTAQDEMRLTVKEPDSGFDAGTPIIIVLVMLIAVVAAIIILKKRQ